MSLLFAIALLAQDKTAEETFKKIEEKLLKAKTVRIKVKTVAHNEGHPDSEGSYELLLKEGNKVYFARSTNHKDDENLFFISDGVKIATNCPGWKTADVPANLGSNAAITLMREEFNLNILPQKKGASAKDLCDLSDFKIEEADGGARILSYKMSGDPGWKVKLWHDPRTFKFVKRTFSIKGRTSNAILSETYEAFELDADIPDEKFKLPAEK